MLGSIATPICAVAEESEAVEMQDGEIQDDGILEYVALGDSISNGYSADPESEIISYPQLIAHDLEEMAGEDVELSKDTTANQGLAALQDGIKANPLLLVKVVSAISNWDYTSFEDDWKLTMENIDSMRPANSEMIVTTIYNPVESMELPGTLNSIVEGLISKMNDIIVSYADDYDYKVVELLDSGIGEKVQSDGLHPNQEGQQLICDLMEETATSEPFEEIREYREEQEREKQEALEAAKRQKEQEEAEKKALEEKKERRKTVVSCVSLAVAVGLMALLRKKTENEERNKQSGKK